jgi:hypothetical protein
MSFSSLPNCPLNDNSFEINCAEKSRQGTSPFRVMLGVGCLLAIAALLYCAWRMVTASEPAPPSPRIPLDFKLIQERFGRVPLGATREEVEEMLGPPSSCPAWDADFDSINRLVEAHSDRYRGDWLWAKWTDSIDEGKWVAVFFCGGTARHFLTNGF